MVVALSQTSSDSGSCAAPLYICIGVFVDSYFPGQCEGLGYFVEGLSAFPMGLAAVVHKL